MKNTLTLAASLLLLLTGCLENETPCTYNRLSIAILTSGEWNVDTFHVFIYDSVSLYQRDTTYINDGTLRFQSDKLDCSEKYATPSGTLLFYRSDGNSYLMNYSISGYEPYLYNIIRISSAESLDGFTEPYDIKIWNRIMDNKMTISFNYLYSGGPPYGYLNPNLKYVRYWEFNLTKK